MLNLKENIDYSLFGEDGSCRDENGVEIRDWFNRSYVYRLTGGKPNGKFLFFIRRNTLDNSTAKVRIATARIVGVDEDSSITIA